MRALVNRENATEALPFKKSICRRTILIREFVICLPNVVFIAIIITIVVVVVFVVAVAVVVVALLGIKICSRRSERWEEPLDSFRQ